MKRVLTFVVFLAVCIGVAIANSYRPRTLDEKVADADLVIMGAATAFGPERVAVNDGFFRAVSLL